MTLQLNLNQPRLSLNVGGKLSHMLVFFWPNYGMDTTVYRYNTLKDGHPHIHITNSCHTTDINKRQDGNVLLPKATSLVPREPNWAQFWKNLEHGCVGYGTNWNGKDCGDE